MTIAISIAVSEGLVLAADTMRVVSTSASANHHYVGADKIFRLSRRLPIGLLTWGEGFVGRSPIANIAGELVNAFDGTAEVTALALNPLSYTVNDVAAAVQRHVHDKYYAPSYGMFSHEQRPDVGLIVAGYSHKSSTGEVWLCSIDKGGALSPVKSVATLYLAGEPEASHRLFFGMPMGYVDVIAEEVAGPSEAARITLAIQRKLSVPLWRREMPLRSAVELAEFLVYAESIFSRFAPVGTSAVGGGVDVAVITPSGGLEIVRGRRTPDTPWGHRAGLPSRITNRRRR